LRRRYQRGCAGVRAPLGGAGAYACKPWDVYALRARDDVSDARHTGGGNWSGASFDGASGYLFVNANELGAIGAMEPQAADAPERFRRGSKGGEYARFWDERQWPCQKPPWGTLNAVNVNTGDIAWKVPLGAVDELK